MNSRVLFYTQHLLGIGHLVRSLRISAALVEAGFAVDLVIGGAPVAGLAAAGARVVQLPPVKAGPDGFSALVTPAGGPVDAAYLDARRERLLAALAEARPDVLLIEAFPFARRMLRGEILPLIEAARCTAPPPLVVSSVRDILQVERREERRRETSALLASVFDAVLVHGDPRFARLDETFPEAAQFQAKIIYTGFVAPPRRAADVIEPADVVVAAGGGAVGYEVIAAALEAKARTRLAAARWLAVTGPNMPEPQRLRIERLGLESGVRIVPFLADLPAWFAAARLAIAQAGYNTVADLLQARCRSVLVPFAAGGETEQTERCTRLARHRLAVTLTPADLDADRMAAAIEAALDTPALDATGLDLDGAAATAAILGRLIRSRSA